MAFGIDDWGSASGSWQQLGSQAIGIAGQVYQQQLAKKAARKAQRSTLSQRPGWGVMNYSTTPMRLTPGSEPAPYGRGPTGGGGILGSIQDYLKKNLPPGPWDIGRGDVLNTTYYDPTPGPWAADDPRSMDTVPSSGGRYDKCGRWVPTKPRAPHSIEALGPDGKPVVYINRGRCVLYGGDIAAIRRVQRVAALCASALTGSPTRRRSTKRKKSRGKRRRKVACRTLSPKQLAAGFGGKQYR